MIQKFGEFDGVDVAEARLVNEAGFEASVIGWGASLRDLVVPCGHGRQRVVLGLSTLADYVSHSPHMGAIAGRCANRIARGRFEIDGVVYEAPTNAGRHALHGGPQGFGKRPWTLGARGADFVEFRLVSPSGDMGFPGELKASALYRLLDDGLRIELTATTDAPTLCNLATHSYFNLDGSADILDHALTIASGFHTPVDADLVPTGEILSVANTRFDFRAPRLVRDATGGSYDNNFMLARMPDPATGLAFAAELRSRRNGLAMRLLTSEPALQFYDAARLSIPVAGHNGALYGAHAGLCLEPQGVPDAANRRHMPGVTLRPGQTYRQVVEYRFALG